MRRLAFVMLARINAALCTIAGSTLWLLKGGHDRRTWLTTAGGVQRYRDAATTWHRFAINPPDLDR